MGYARRLIFGLVILLTVGTVTQAQQTVFIPVCSGTNDTAKFTTIITTIGANTGTIRLPYKKSTAGSRCAVNNLTIPANVTLDNSDGTGIKINTGQTLTAVGPVVSPAKPFFYNATAGLGTVSFSGNQKLSLMYPEWWGAVADGVTDSSASIIAAALGAAGNTLRFASGVYRTNQIALPSNSYIVLAPGTIIKLLDGLNTKYVFYIREKSNIVIEGSGVVDANKAASVKTSGIHVEGVTGLKIRGITIQNGEDGGTGNDGDGIYLGIAITSGIITLPTDVLIEGCTITGNERQAISFIAGKNVRILNNLLKDTTLLDPGFGIDMEPNPSSFRRTVTDAVTNSTTTVTSETADFTSDDDDFSPQVIITDTSGNTFVSPIASVTNESTIELTTAVPFTGTGLTMFISQVYETFEDVIIANNTIKGNLGGGFVISNVNNAPFKNILLQGNTITDNGRTGLSIAANFMDGFIFIGNTVSGTTGSCTGDALGYGVRISSNQGVLIQGNDIHDNTCQGIRTESSLHYSIIGNKVIRNGGAGIVLINALAPGTIGESGIVAFNRVFNNGVNSANVHSGIYVGGRANENVGINISHNQLGNDPNIRYTPTQKYGIDFADDHGQNVVLDFNFFVGNISGKINASSSLNATLQTGDWAQDQLTNLVFGYGTDGAQSPILLTTATQGFPFGIGTAGTPTGVPANPAAAVGRVPYVFNTTDKRFAFNDGTSWWESAASLFGSAALDFGSIAGQTSAELTIAVTGAAVGNACMATPSGAPEAGLIWGAYVSSADVVTVRLTNVTVGAIDPASRTWRVQVNK